MQKDNDKTIDTKQLQTTTYNQLLAYLFIKGVDTKKTGDLHMVLSNSFALGTNQYPQDLASAASAAATYKAMYKSNHDPKSNKSKNPAPTEEEKKDDDPESQDTPELQQAEQLLHKLGFLQETDPSKLKCYRCQQFGHTSPNCTAPAPVAPPKDGAHTQVAQNFFCTNFPQETNI